MVWGCDAVWWRIAGGDRCERYVTVFVVVGGGVLTRASHPLGGGSLGRVCGIFVLCGGCRGERLGCRGAVWEGWKKRQAFVVHLLRKGHV
jgi:hypothetical protein